MGLIEVGSKPLNGEWIILRLTPKGHDFLERGQNTEQNHLASVKLPAAISALKEPERITLAEGLTLLDRHVPTEQAKARLRQAFIQRDLIQSQLPLIALPYDDADIDWATGSVKIPRQKARFCPTFLRADFNAYFFADRVASPSHPRQTAINADMRTAVGVQLNSTTVETSSLPQPEETPNAQTHFHGYEPELE